MTSPARFSMRLCRTRDVQVVPAVWIRSPHLHLPVPTKCARPSQMRSRGKAGTTIRMAKLVTFAPGRPRQSANTPSSSNGLTKPTNACKERHPSQNWISSPPLSPHRRHSGTRPSQSARRAGHPLPWCASTRSMVGPPDLYSEVPCLTYRETKTGYCPAPVFSAGFSAGFFGAAATELPPFGFQKSSALIHSAGT